MKRSVILGLLLLFTQAYGEEFLVKYKNTSGLNSIRFMAKDASQMLFLEDITSAQLVKVDIPNLQKAKTLAQLLSKPGVEYVVPNFKLKAFFAPVEATALKEQWANNKVQLEKAWQRAGNKGNKKVIVAVIDTGIDYKHKNLASNVIPGYDFKDNDNDPMDKTGSQNPGHGTHCSGSIGGNGLVDGGIVGISPEVSLMPVRFLGEDGSGSLDAGIKAIDYAIEKGANVISASWGASVPRSQAQPLIEAVKRADDKGVIFVAAAANDGKNNDKSDVFPANSGFPNTITVAASGASDTKPSWSNYGKAMVHVSSPGEGIMSTLPGDNYGNLSGTSMATPLVSGLVAFLKAQDMSLTGAQIRAILQTTGAKVGIETACDCRVDAFNAVDAILSKKLTVVPAAATVASGSKLNFSALFANGAVKFASSNPAVATITEAGELSAVADGQTTVNVTDASGKKATSLNIYVGKSSGGDNPPDDGGGGGGLPPMECPFDPQICQIICQLKPDLPFCK